MRVRAWSLRGVYCLRARARPAGRVGMVQSVCVLVMCLSNPTQLTEAAACVMAMSTWLKSPLSLPRGPSTVTLRPLTVIVTSSSYVISFEERMSFMVADGWSAATRE